MGLSKKLMTQLFTNLVRAYHFDELFARRLTRGELIGFYHPAAGHYAPGVAAGTVLEKEDYMWPHHRAHGVPHMLSKGCDIKYFLAEHTGKETGCCSGRTSWHWSYPEFGIFGMTGFIGGGFSQMVGYGWAAQKNGRKQVAMSCTGDGSFNNGRAHESMLMASNWKLPIIFLCENNGWAIHSRIEDMHPTEDIASLAPGLNIPAAIVDGQDVFACAEALQEAVKRARKGDGPTLIEAKTVRWREHDIGTPDLDGYRQRTKEELEALHDRDPLKIATQQVLETKLLTQAQIDKIHEDALAECDACEKFADESAIAEPTVEELRASVYAD
ncbi:MAG: thiamine pyrophosphate-dependent dehydrogenase E1 component subunit alpha [Paracoccaceae bacterium]